MRLTLRIKLLTIVAINALALLVLVAVGAFTADRVETHLHDIRARHLPRVALRPQLEGQFERMQHALQDAAAAADPDLLAATREHRDALVAAVAGTVPVLTAHDAAVLERAFEAYYDAAYRLAQSLIDGVEPHELAGEIEEMQMRRERALALIAEHAAFDEHQLAAAFASASGAQRTATRIRLLVTAACLVSVLALSLWISRGVLRRVDDLTAGLQRFADGELDARIPLGSRDELGDVAARANDMAESLQRLGDERSKVDWLRFGRAGLVQELSGELEPHEVASRSIGFLARYVGAPVGALYYEDAAGELCLLGGYGLSDDDAAARADGVVRQAALGPDLTLIEAPGDQLRIRSAAVEGAPRAVALVPLVHAGATKGVLELAVLQPWHDRHGELVLSVRDMIASAIEVARGRAATRALLAETTAQAGALEKQRVALQSKNAELVEARRHLEQKAAELAAASRYKSQFLANMSHELRTPLNAIIGFAELMHDGVVTPETPQYKEFLGDILTSGRHLLELINDVLDLSKVEAGKLEFRPEPVDLTAVVGEVLAILRTTAATKRIAVHSAVDPGMGQVVIDPGRLKQVLYNYVSNALKFTPEGGRVTIRATPEVGDGDAFRLEVEDTGVGIAAGDLARLFVEFQQLRGGGARTQGGTGLGLALTKRLVEAQGGRVGVRSELGAGSVFFAVLPRRAAVVPAAPELHIPEAVAGAPSVLVIEDDPADQAELVGALTRAGYAVEVAATGAQALERARERAFDAITLDLLLPDMSGVEVLRAIRAGGPNRDVPIIVITVVTEPGAVTGFAVHDVLTKPLREGDLHGAFARAGFTPHHPGTVLVVDDDPAAQKLLTATLEGLGYEAVCASDGASALHAARERPPSAIVLDLLMPGMNGFEFLDQLRSAPAGRRVPVIVWTVLDLTAEQRARLRSAAQAVVCKGRGGSAAVVAELAAFVPQPGAA